MAEFSDRKTTRPTGKTAPPPPEACMKGSCQSETGIAFVRVLNNNTGRKEIRSFGKSGHMIDGQLKETRSVGVHSKDAGISMNDQFEFLGWITRCPKCYMDDLESSRKRAVDRIRSLRQQEGEPK